MFIFIFAMIINLLYLTMKSVEIATLIVLLISVFL
jgi:hypothetical protein